MKRGYSYVVSRDYGFAPNPFGGICSLATCKPKIRNTAKIGDIIFGISPKRFNNELVYAMKVSKKITFDDYWNDEEYQFKKAVMNGSIKTSFGDNIYHYDPSTKIWIQADSHHSKEDGITNLLNLRRDTQTNAVLLADEFFYFGEKTIEIPVHKENFIISRGYKIIDYNISNEIWDWLMGNYKLGIRNFPRLFRKGFERYNGK